MARASCSRIRACTYMHDMRYFYFLKLMYIVCITYPLKFVFKLIHTGCLSRNPAFMCIQFFQLTVNFNSFFLKNLKLFFLLYSFCAYHVVFLDLYRDLKTVSYLVIVLPPCVVFTFWSSTSSAFSPTPAPCFRFPGF